jgi:hypothetical protein
LHDLLDLGAHFVEFVEWQLVNFDVVEVFVPTFSELLVVAAYLVANQRFFHACYILLHLVEKIV